MLITFKEDLFKSIQNRHTTLQHALHHGEQIWAQSGSDWRQNVLSLIWNNPRICPIWGQSNPLWRIFDIGELELLSLGSDWEIIPFTLNSSFSCHFSLNFFWLLVCWIRKYIHLDKTKCVFNEAPRESHLFWALPMNVYFLFVFWVSVDSCFTVQSSE